MKEKSKKQTRGGKREGSGRKLKFNEETTTVAFRVPISLKPKIIEVVTDLLRAAGKNKTGN